jgi:hypothetical protein
MNAITQIKQANPALYRLGIGLLILFVLLLVWYPFNPYVVLGLNSVIKPIKFALSSTIFAFTMATFLQYLDDKPKVRAYTKAAVFVLWFEQVIITGQALLGRRSHFNNDDVVSIILFALMGIAIVSLMVWTGYIAYLFFKQKQFTIAPAYLWSIRLGLIIFVIFSMEGGIMARHMSHTVGGADGGVGLPFVNWSTLYGDLRTAHFMGMHALQIIPLIGYFLLSKSKNGVLLIVLIALAYAGFTGWLFVRAMNGLPLI